MLSLCCFHVDFVRNSCDHLTAAQCHLYKVVDIYHLRLIIFPARYLTTETEKYFIILTKSNAN